MARSSKHQDESDDDDYERDDARAEEAGGRRGRKKRSKAPDDEDRGFGDGSDDDGERKHKKSKKKKKKVKVMEASGQTDEERRALRRNQRKLQHKIAHSEEGALMEDPNKDAFAKIREENNELFDDVRYTREAVLDGDNLELISRRAARQVDRLVQVPRYDSSRFIQKLRSKLTNKAGSTTYFDWRMLGQEAGICFNAVPSRVSFLNGPVDVVYVPKERKKREKRQVEEEEEEEEEQPEELKQKDGATDGDKLSAVEKNIATVHKVLNKMSGARYKESEAKLKEEEDTMDKAERKKKKKRLNTKGAEIDAVQHLFNPKSFTQTVENIFHFSFLVKKGDAGIGIRTEEEAKEWGGVPGPVVRAIPTNGHKHPPSKQAIVSLNMQDWRDMVAAYGVTKSDVPHRSQGSRGAKRSRS